MFLSALYMAVQLINDGTNTECSKFSICKNLPCNLREELMKRVVFGKKMCVLF